MEWESWNLNSELLGCHFIFYNCISWTSSKILPIYKIRSWRCLLCTHSRSCLTILQTPLLLPNNVLCPYTTSFRKTTFHQESSLYRSLDHSWRFNAKEVSCEYLVHRPLNFYGIFRSLTWPFLCLFKSCISFLFLLPASQTVSHRREERTCLSISYAWCFLHNTKDWMQCKFQNNV